MSKRSKARELALQMLFLVDMNPDIDHTTVLKMIQERLKDEELSRLGWQLFSGTVDHREKIDEQISSIAKNWSLKRMAATDRNLIRLACFEAQYFGTPRSVVIQEAINLAKKFGSEKSSAFVNGVLDKLNQADSIENFDKIPTQDQNE